MLDLYFVARVRENDNKIPVSQRFQGGRGAVRMMGGGRGSWCVHLHASRGVAVVRVSENCVNVGLQGGRGGVRVTGGWRVRLQVSRVS